MYTEKERDMLCSRLREGIDEHARCVEVALMRARRTCITCAHFNDVTEMCEFVRTPVRPPARVIAFGCPKYELLPF